MEKILSVTLPPQALPLTDIKVCFWLLCVFEELFGIFLKSIFFIFEPLTCDLVLSPSMDSRVVCSAPWWFTAHCTWWICMWTCHLFSIHHQNNAKYALLYAFQYSQLSSNRLPLVHYKVAAYQRLSSVGKKKEEYLKFLSQEEVVVI